jgi:hypothetical protein
MVKTILHDSGETPLGAARLKPWVPGLGAPQQGWQCGEVEIFQQILA